MVSIYIVYTTGSQTVFEICVVRSMVEAPKLCEISRNVHWNKIRVTITIEIINLINRLIKVILLSVLSVLKITAQNLHLFYFLFTDLQCTILVKIPLNILPHTSLQCCYLLILLNNQTDETTWNRRNNILKRCSVFKIHLSASRFIPDGYRPDKEMISQWFQTWSICGKEEGKVWDQSLNCPTNLSIFATTACMA